MPFIPESTFFRGKVHNRRALRFGQSSHQALRDLQCPHHPQPPSSISQTDKTLLPEGRWAGSAGWGNSRSGRWAGPRWSSKPEKRKWHSGGVLWLSSVCPFKLWNAWCKLITPLLHVSNAVSQLQWLPLTVCGCFYDNLIALSFNWGKLCL